MNLRARFLDLQSLLTRLDSLWRPAPFHVARPQWCTQWPGLAAALEALDDQHVEQLGEDFEACATWLTSHLPELARLVEGCRVPELPERSLPACDAHFDDGVPGRKRSQIEAFARHMPAATSPVLEWRRKGAPRATRGPRRPHAGDFARARPEVVCRRSPPGCPTADGSARGVRQRARRRLPCS